MQPLAPPHACFSAAAGGPALAAVAAEGFPAGRRAEAPEPAGAAEIMEFSVGASGTSAGTVALPPQPAAPVRIPPTAAAAKVLLMDDIIRFSRWIQSRGGNYPVALAIPVCW